MRIVLIIIENYRVNDIKNKVCIVLTIVLIEYHKVTTSTVKYHYQLLLCHIRSIILFMLLRLAYQRPT